MIPEDLIAEIAATVPPGVAPFLLTSQIEVDALIEQQRRTRLNTLQLIIRRREHTKRCEMRCAELRWCR